MNDEKILKDVLPVYRKVLKRFPEIKEGELKIVFSTKCLEAGLSMINLERFYWNKEFVREPTLAFGPLFFDFTSDKQEGIIAHELGHYIRYRHHCLNRIMRTIYWSTELSNYLLKGTIPRILINLSKKNRLRNKRLKKRYLLNELYADNQAVKRGYGRHLLDFLTKEKNKVYFHIMEVAKEEYKARIENLEKILGE